MTRILFLAINPKDTPSVRLDGEIKTIEQRIRLAEMRDLFDVKQEWALRTDDLHRVLLQHKPEIVHFAGPGTALGEIILTDRSGNSFPVSARAVGDLFSILKDNIRCVVINACCSKAQARAIFEHVDCVICWPQMVTDGAAICFAAAFYQALGFGRTMKTAFELACNQLRLEDLNRRLFPRILARRTPSGAKTQTESFGSNNAHRVPRPRHKPFVDSCISGAGDRLPRNCDVDHFVSSERFLRGQPEGSDRNMVRSIDSILLSRLNAGPANERSETARQLGYLKDPGAIPILEMRWPLEVDPTVRYWLAVAIGWIGGEQAVQVLQGLKQNEKDQFAKSGIDEALGADRKLV